MRAIEASWWVGLDRAAFSIQASREAMRMRTVRQGPASWVSGLVSGVDVPPDRSRKSASIAGTRARGRLGDEDED